jgi:chemotaxis protein MotB
MNPEEQNEQNNQPPVIVKKKKKGEGHHGGAWKVAYADFVTAMMALFIVLWVLNQSDEVKQKVSGYFKDPSVFNIGKGASVIDKSKPGNPDSRKMEDEILSKLEMKRLEKQKLKEMGEDIINKLNRKGEFDSIMDQIEIEIVNEGLRIEIMESNTDVFFDVGTSRLNKRSKKLLHVIANQLTQIDNKIVIEGHTDSRPYNNGIDGYSNYELSADRANAARRQLLKGGVLESHIHEIRGYADNQLRKRNDPYDISNRRISIIVKYSQENEKQHISN